jgi:hypothetical protein
MTDRHSTAALDEMAHRLRGQAVVEQSMYRAGGRTLPPADLLPVETGSIDNTQVMPVTMPIRARAGL